MSARVQRRVFVSGTVQGVGFRASTLAFCRQFKDLQGYVRNLPDGRVEVALQADLETVDRITHWLKEGPDMASVDHLEQVEEQVDQTWNYFQIR